MAVSSRADDAIAPALVAPIARDSANATIKPLPVPSCSTETKHGNPLPFSYKERTDDPIILDASINEGLNKFNELTLEQPSQHLAQD